MLGSPRTGLRPCGGYAGVPEPGSPGSGLCFLAGREGSFSLARLPGAGGESCRWGGKIGLSSRQDQILSSEGVDILPVKPNVMANFGPHQYVCSALGSRPVKIKHISISRALRTTNRRARTVLVLALAPWA